jgi:hypothetical protein
MREKSKHKFHNFHKLKQKLILIILVKPNILEHTTLFFSVSVSAPVDLFF